MSVNAVEFNDIDYTKSRTAVINAASYDADGTNDYTVNADGLTQIRDSNALILALIEEDADLNNTERSDASRQIPIDFDENFTLTYTLAGYGNNVIGVASANIAKVNGVATADISKIIGI